MSYSRPTSEEQRNWPDEPVVRHPKIEIDWESGRERRSISNEAWGPWVKIGTLDHYDPMNLYDAKQVQKHPRSHHILKQIAAGLWSGFLQGVGIVTALMLAYWYFQ